MKHTLVTPSWKTGLYQRVRAIPLDKILDVLIATLFILMLIGMLVVPILLAYYMPPTLDF